MSEMTGQTGVDIKVALTANWENVYFETNGNRFNLGNIAIDTDSRGVNGDSNVPFDITMDAVNDGYRKGIQLGISNINSLNFTINDVFLSYDPSIDTTKDVYGTLGIENVNFNGGEAEMYILGRAGSGDTGTEIGFSLPDGTTLDFTINDFEDAAGNAVADKADAVKGGELRATIEFNDFSTGSTTDLVAQGNDENGVDQGVGLLIQYTHMEGSMDIRNIAAGDGSRAGSYGRLLIDGMRMNRGYVLVDPLP